MIFESSFWGNSDFRIYGDIFLSSFGVLLLITTFPSFSGNNRGEWFLFLILSLDSLFLTADRLTETFLSPSLSNSSPYSSTSWDSVLSLELTMSGVAPEESLTILDLFLPTLLLLESRELLSLLIAITLLLLFFWMFGSILWESFVDDVALDFMEPNNLILWFDSLVIFIFAFVDFTLDLESFQLMLYFIYKLIIEVYFLHTSSHLVILLYLMKYEAKPL